MPKARTISKSAAIAAERGVRDSEIEWLYRSGLGLTEIGRQLGLTGEGVRGALTRRGVPRRTAADRSKANDARNDRIVAMYQRGMTCKAIGTKVGISWSIVHQVLVKRGVPRKPFGWYPAPESRKKLECRERVRVVAHLYDTGPGTSAMDLGRITGLNAHTVRRHLVALGVKVRCGAGYDTAVTPAQARRIKKELVDGESTFQSIADKYGISKNVVTAIAMERSYANIPWPKGARYSRRTHGRPKKLTEAQVRRIKIELLKPNRSYSEIGNRYGVGGSNVFCIAMEKVWKQVPWPEGRRFTRRGKPRKTILNHDTAKQIKKLLCGDEFTTDEIGAKFGVTGSAIQHIAAGDTWKAVPWPTKHGYPGRAPGWRATVRRKGGMVLDTEERRRFEIEKGERRWEESRGRGKPV